MHEIQRIKIEEIVPYENNPRYNENAIDKVAKSIQEFGFTNPILLDKDNVIIAGHTRYEASKKLGINEVDCIYLTDLSEEQIKAYRLVDNKTAEFATWDFDKLMEEIDEIADSIDIAEYGFSQIELDLIDDIVSKVEEAEEPEEKNEAQLMCPNCNHIASKGDFISC